MSLTTLLTVLSCRKLMSYHTVGSFLCMPSVHMITLLYCGWDIICFLLLLLKTIFATLPSRHWPFPQISKYLPAEVDDLLVTIVCTEKQGNQESLRCLTTLSSLLKANSVGNMSISVRSYNLVINLHELRRIVAENREGFINRPWTWESATASQKHLLGFIMRGLRKILF